MAVDITICLPGIRVDAWPKMYESIKTSVSSHSFEFIIVGPYTPPDLLLQQDEIPTYRTTDVHLAVYR